MSRVRLDLLLNEMGLGKASALATVVVTAVVASVYNDPGQPVVRATAGESVPTHVFNRERTRSFQTPAAAIVTDCSEDSFGRDWAFNAAASGAYAMIFCGLARTQDAHSLAADPRSDGVVRNVLYLPNKPDSVTRAYKRIAKAIHGTGALTTTASLRTVVYSSDIQPDPEGSLGGADFKKMVSKFSLFSILTFVREFKPLLYRPKLDVQFVVVARALSSASASDPFAYMAEQEARVGLARTLELKYGPGFVAHVVRVE